MLTLHELLQQAVTAGASDLHIQENCRPALRIQGSIRFLDLDPLDEETVANMIFPIMNESDYETFITMGDVDFSYEVPDLARFRVNAMNQYNGRGAVLRVIPNSIPTIEDLGLPKVIETFGDLDKGLILVTGPTGSGKSTTLAAILNRINHTRTDHIITIEDPIEFIHPLGKSYLEQRELGRHAKNFADALRDSLRESPDVVMIGEMRDLDTIQQALRAAETGHLVLATLHTNSVAQTLSRIVDVFPPEEQAQIRSLLSGCLKAVVCQQLIPKLSGGRIAAMEIMIVNTSLAGIIRDGRISQVRSFLMMGRSEGMQTLDLHLAYLLHNRQISREMAEDLCTDIEIIKRHNELFT
ncbi:PilT/PilU family type 4a pilus ATPase [bacterium]|nr:PilT/PilU family type 4a pilus ATPase [bacterium]